MKEKKERYFYYGICPGLNDVKVYKVKDKWADFPYIARVSNNWELDYEGNYRHSVKILRKGRLSNLSQNGWAVEDNAAFVVVGERIEFEFFFHNEKYGSWCIYKGGGVLADGETLGMAIEKALGNFYRTANFYTPILSIIYESAGFILSFKDNYINLNPEDINELLCKIRYIKEMKEKVHEDEYMNGTDNEIWLFNTRYKEMCELEKVLISHRNEHERIKR